MLAKKDRIKTDLNLFLLIITALIAIGLIFIYSSSSVFAMEKFACPHYFVKKQVFGLILGLIGAIFIFILPIKFIKKITPYIFWGSLLLTSATMIPGLTQRIHGSARWINLFGFSFQPSEILKITLVLYIAYFITKKQDKLNSFFHAYLPVLVIVTATGLILLKQPDFGLTVTLIATVFTMMFIAKFNPKHLILTFAALVPAAVTLVLLKPYRLQRILTFLNPWQDPQGSGFQIIQSLIAIGSGGLWGVGISNSKQKFFYLPMQHTDFIFSIIAEETGFIGSMCIITLFVALLFLGIRISLKLGEGGISGSGLTPLQGAMGQTGYAQGKSTGFNAISSANENLFSKFVVLGLVVLISIQAIVNLSVAAGLAPTKGIGLPFVSYGNTSLVCNLCMVGLIVNIVYSNLNQNR